MDKEQRKRKKTKSEITHRDSRFSQVFTTGFSPALDPGNSPAINGLENVVSKNSVKLKANCAESFPPPSHFLL